MPSQRFPSRLSLQAAIERVTSHPDTCELIYTSERTFPHAPQPPHYAPDPTTKPHIVIMDSSFNPPHFAHLAMAASSLPPPLSSPIPSSSTCPTPSSEPQPYSARLLLFSVRNIEKTPKPGDATMAQRLEMTILLARRLAQHHALPGGVGVGIINEPTFVGKSRIVHSFLATQNPGTGRTARLSFLIGTDTLTRFFEPKFYGGAEGMERASREYFGHGGEGEGSILVCGRRGEGEENRRIEQDVLERDEVRPWVERGCVRMLGTGKEGWEEVSSTRIRTAVKEGDGKTLEKLVPREIAEYIRGEGLYTD